MKHVLSDNFLRFAQAAALILLAVPQQLLAQPANETVARLKNVDGNVLVSKESGLASGDERLRLTKGTRVITTANARVTVVYDNGCEVQLKENQRFEVVTDKPCSALVAQASTILLEPGGIATVATAGGLVINAALIPLIGGVAGVEAIKQLRDTRSVSPS
jgi:hypothetical protein